MARILVRLRAGDARVVSESDATTANEDDDLGSMFATKVEESESLPLSSLASLRSAMAADIASTPVAEGRAGHLDLG